MSPERGEDQLTEPQTLRAWLRDLQGHNGVESFKKKVINRKTGDMEERQHVWVQTGFERHKLEENRSTKSSSVSVSNKDFTTAQVQEAQNKVFAFAAWLH